MSDNALPLLSEIPIGEERFTEFVDYRQNGKIRIQYNYRHTDGILYSTIDDTVEAARAKRDAWLARREKVSQ